MKLRTLELLTLALVLPGMPMLAHADAYSREDVGERIASQLLVAPAVGSSEDPGLSEGEIRQVFVERAHELLPEAHEWQSAPDFSFIDKGQVHLMYSDREFVEASADVAILMALQRVEIQARVPELTDAEVDEIAESVGRAMTNLETVLMSELVPPLDPTDVIAIVDREHQRLLNWIPDSGVPYMKRPVSEVSAREVQQELEARKENILDGLQRQREHYERLDLDVPAVRDSFRHAQYRVLNDLVQAVRNALLADTWHGSHEDYENLVPELPEAMGRLDRLGQDRFLAQHAPAP